jgi:ferrous iron transport protein B
MQEAVKASNKERKGATIIEDKSLLHLISDVQIAFELKGIENPLFHAIKLVEMDELEVKMHPEAVETVNKFKATFKNDTFGSDFEALIADNRYEHIAKNYATAFERASGLERKDTLTKSDKIDKVMTHRIWALPLFVVIMFFIFHVTFSEDVLFLNRIFGLEITHEGWINFFTGMGYEGEPLGGIPSIGVWLQSWFGWLTGSLIDWVGSLMPAGQWYTSLVCDGILTGLDAVLSFVPQIMILFLFIAILEDSGYMARVAFILDRAFRKFGLSGKAFIPMLTGFG